MDKILSSFDVYTIATELDTYLSESFIDKCYQPEKDVITIRINNRTIKQKQTLYIKNESFCCLTTKSIPAPKKPSLFAMTLRKYITNGRIQHIRQLAFDRILIIDISKQEGIYHIIIELFKNGNIILTGPDDTIILPLKRQHWATRTLKSKQPYQPPPPQLNPFDITKDQLSTLLKESNADLVRTLATTLNLSGPYAEELLYRSQLDKHQPAADLTTETINTLYTHIQELLKPFRDTTFTPTLIQKEDTLIDITPIPFQHHTETQQIPQESFSLAMQQLIIDTPPPQTKEQTNKHERQLGRLQRQLQQQETSIKKFETDIITQQQYGDLIYLHFQTLTTQLETLQQLLKSKDKQTLQDYLKNHPEITTYDPTNATLQITLEDLEQHKHALTLNTKKTVQDNANTYYQSSKKLQEKLTGAKKALQNTQEKLKKAQTDLKTFEEAQEDKQRHTPQKTHWFEHYRWFITSEGHLVIGGRDAKTNDSAVKKHLHGSDRYIHADIHGAPSCILKHTTAQGQELEITENALTQACIFAGSYSRAWSQFAEVQTYWVNPEQVSQTPESGEFLPRGAFIIRGKRNYQRCTLELSIGIITYEDDKKIMAGPTEAIKHHCDQYITLKPGPIKKQEISKTIAKAFHVPTSTIDRALPPGNCSITTTHNITLENDT